MLSFMFWNINRQNVLDHVSALVAEQDVDFLLLAENGINKARLLQSLNPPGRRDYFYVPSFTRSKVDIYARFDPRFILPKHDTSRATFRRISLPLRREFLLCAVHLQSQLHWDEQDQTCAAAELNTTIRGIEREIGHRRTILVGDLNMNPFSDGLTYAHAFNAVRTMDIAFKRHRTISETTHPFFFNPMWKLFHDGRDARPKGTYYHNPNGYPSLHWHIFDQVLIRPDLIDSFDFENLKIITSHSGTPLVNTQGKPCISDHLPILFKINI